MNIILPLLAIAVFGAFLAVLIWHVPSPDLIAVVLLTLGFAAFDLYRSEGKRGNR